jgi:hypothetical protein
MFPAGKDLKHVPDLLNGVCCDSLCKKSKRIIQPPQVTEYKLNDYEEKYLLRCDTCSLENIRRFEGTYRFHLPGNRVSQATSKEKQEASLTWFHD